MPFQNDPDGTRLPVKLDTATNGEFAPIPLEPVHHRANALAYETSGANAKRLNMRRREFLVSACGVTTTLLSMNAAYAGEARRGGFYHIPQEAALDLELARSAVDGQEFIFDVQGHFIDPSGAWTKRLPPEAKPLSEFTFRPEPHCKPDQSPGIEYLRCLGPDQFIKDVFMDSDTDLMVLSFVPSSFMPSTRGVKNLLTIEEAVNTAKIVEKLDGTHRMYIHGRVEPTQQGYLEGMDELAARYKISAWKTYTQPPVGPGFWLDDDVGLAFIEKARRLGVRNIAVHKGIPLGPEETYKYSTCADVGRVAKHFPDVNFLIYHSGFAPTKPERAYDPTRTDGVDALCTSLTQNGIKPGSNVYAELGSTWRAWMRDPDSAAHGLGKLFKFCGPDNVLWGTDCIFYGSPQDQIQAFRTFQIVPELRDRYGYPEITPALRAKVFGLNALKIYPVPAEVLDKHIKQDRVAKSRAAYRQDPDPSFQTYGPKTRREFLRLKQRAG